MRALRDIVAAPYARHVVAKYTAAGTYSLTLAPGKYHVVLVGAGGGSATAGYTTERGESSAVGKLGYATGGGGALAMGDITFAATTQVSVVVGAGSAGSAMTKIGDSASSQYANIGYGGVTSFSFGTSIAELECGNTPAYAIVSINTSSEHIRPGGGGRITQYILGLSHYQGEDGSMPPNGTAITEIADGTSLNVQGGMAGGYDGVNRVPEALGDAGRGGDVSYGYADGVLVFNGGNGRDGAVLIERIG